MRKLIVIVSLEVNFWSLNLCIGNETKKIKGSTVTLYKIP